MLAFRIYLISGEFKKHKERENQNEMARFTKALLLEKMCREGQAEERVPMSNVDTGCVEEKVYCSSVFVDLSVVYLSYP